MGRKLKVTAKARKSTIQIAAYIAEKFGEDRAKKYFYELEEQLQRILTHPDRYPIIISGRQSVRKSVFEKRTIIMYRFTATTVTIVSIKDARSDWKK
jgi:plasmid stabilization system protein ParE